MIRDEWAKTKGLGEGGSTNKEAERDARGQAGGPNAGSALGGGSSKRRGAFGVGRTAVGRPVGSATGLTRRLMERETERRWGLSRGGWLQALLAGLARRRPTGDAAAGDPRRQRQLRRRGRAT